ncbi:MAG: hypothetical protein ACWGSQ_14715 [Longimicrobiales bacterium]
MAPATRTRALESRPRAVASCLAAIPIFLLAHPLQAQFTLLEGEKNSLELGGYFRSLTGLYDQGYRIPDLDRVSGFNAEVVRLKWILRLGDRGVVEIHDRFQAQASSSPQFVSSGPGLGVTVVPGRSLDLSTVFIDQDRLKVWHDVDRLSLTLNSHIGDVTVGRQAITWGISNLFPVADLWAQFSPFELDTEEKPGIDAVRFLSYPTGALELDAVVADRGSADDLSAGIRATLSLPRADVHLGGGKFWNEAMILGGIAAPVGSWKLRAEGVLPYDLDTNDLDLPRLTLGVDRLGGELLLSGEYHLNGIGAASADDYGDILEDPRFARGESYFLGRHYLGGLCNWTPGNDRLSLALSAMVNLVDRSTILSPALTYDFGQETRLSVGGYLSSGNPPVLEPVPVLKSEYGIYGDLLFTMVSIYF